MQYESEEEHRREKKEALERTSILANERTYAAWIRTGLTALVTTLGFIGFMSSLLAPIPFAIVTFLLGGCSAACFIMGAWRYHHVGIRMVTIKFAGAPIWLLTLLSAILVLVTATTLFAILQITHA